MKLMDVQKDWEANKDFRITTGGYINRREAEQYSVGVVVRYGKNGDRVGTLR